MLYLGGLHYKLQYSHGKQLLNTDTLSRLPPRSPEPEPLEVDLPDYVLALAGFNEEIMSVKELGQLTASDPLLEQVMEFTKNGWLSFVKRLNASKGSMQMGAVLGSQTVVLGLPSWRSNKSKMQCFAHVGRDAPRVVCHEGGCQNIILVDRFGL